MNDEFDAYLNLHAIGTWYKGTLPLVLQQAIDGYNEHLYYTLGGARFNVRNASATAPAATTVLNFAANGLFTTGTQYVAPTRPLALPHTTVLGAEQANIKASLGGTLLNTASPFIYIHPNNPGVSVNYGSDVSVKKFLAAWEALVTAAQKNPVDFTWPSMDGGWDSDHKKVEFAAAAFAESSRSPAQLGAIYLLSKETFRTTFGGQNVWKVLPMCQGGSYVPITMQVLSRTEVMMASTQVYQRCYRISQKDTKLSENLDLTGITRVSQGRSLSGYITTIQSQLASKHCEKEVKRWYR